ncbi:hypothetical protein [Sphingobacterium sp. LRF_L2]|uniref:hypothetical protein n=1 Tax=Sphingobacterium sp. LRF_L2 TaxID=3369421 RepID=UPI003F6159AC
MKNEDQIYTEAALRLIIDIGIIRHMLSDEADGFPSMFRRIRQTVIEREKELKKQLKEIRK